MLLIPLPCRLPLVPHLHACCLICATTCNARRSALAVYLAIVGIHAVRTMQQQLDVGRPCRWCGFKGGWCAVQSFDFMPSSPGASMQSMTQSTMSYDDEDSSESMVYVGAPKVTNHPQSAASLPLYFLPLHFLPLHFPCYLLALLPPGIKENGKAGSKGFLMRFAVLYASHTPRHLSRYIAGC